MLDGLFRSVCGLPGVFLSVQLAAQPLFDTHLHYTADDAQPFTPQDVLHLLDKNAIPYAAITAAPSVHMSELYRMAPGRIVPLLAVYRRPEDKQTWTNDNTLITYLEKELQRGHWQGIGELHIFARDRHSEVFAEVVALASRWQLPLLIHGDPAVIDRVYELAPKQPVVWAHAGTFPYPDLVSDYLQRYPGLSIDLSMRDERIAPGGLITDDWYELFVSYPDRFMVGVDTYSTARWHGYDSAVETIRNWLAQMPEEIALQLALANAARLYNKPLVYQDEEGVGVVGR